MKIARLSIDRPVGTILLVVTIAILSVVTIPNIPVSFWPEFVAPTLIVMAPYPGVGPEEIEEQIATPLEEELSTINDVDEIETACLEGVCRVFVRFSWGVDFDDAKLAVQERTNKARSRFPRQALEPNVLQVQDFIPPGIELAFTSDSRSLNELREFVENKLKNKFLRLSNVATVQVIGGSDNHVLVEAVPGKLQQFGLSINQVFNAIAAENRDLALGKIETSYRYHFVKAEGKYRSLNDLGSTIVAIRGDYPVTVADVAEIRFEEKERSSHTRLNDREIVSMSVREKSGGNTVAMCSEVKEELAYVQNILPADVTVSIVRDQSDFIRRSINNVLRNAAIGAGLASIIILLFLGNLRNTLVIVLSIPISIIATMVLIDRFGLSINTISLGGLALGVGMIVDASVVVIENIFRHLQENPTGDKKELVLKATDEVGMAITSATLTSIVVFLPLAFLIGLAAVLLGELAITVVLALTISVIVAVSIVPMLSYYLMKTDGNKGVFRFMVSAWQHAFEWFAGLYRLSLLWVLRHRILSLALASVLMVLSVRLIMPALDVELLPSVNEGEFRVELELGESTLLSVTNAMVREMEVKLMQYPEIRQVYSVVGLLSVRGELKPNVATITVNLKPEMVSQLAPVMARIRQELNHLPGARLTVRQTDVTEGMKRQPVNIRIAGDDLAVLDSLTMQIINEIEQVPGIVNLASSVQQGLPEIGIRVDRLAGARMGLTAGQVAGSVQMALLGISPTRFSSGGEEYDITLRMAGAQQLSASELMQMTVTTPRGEVVPLRAVAEETFQLSPSQIKRFDQQRTVEILADISGRPQREVQADISAILDRVNFPPDYYYRIGGQSRAIADSFRTLGVAMVISIFLVYVVMGAQFNSFLHPFTIAFSIPLSVIGVLLGLLVFDASISMNALLGSIMLVGIVVNNGILLIDFIRQQRADGVGKEDAIIRAGATRLRPILITSLTTVVGMLPIALGLGEGGEALQPLGAVVVGGLLSSTLLTLLFVPVMYSLFESARDRISRKTVP